MEKEDFGSILYSWEAPEFMVAQGSNWLLDGVLVVAGLGLLIWAIWAGQWTGAALVVMAGVAMFLMRKSQPRIFTHSLTDRGVVVGTKFYPYSRLKSFWIFLEGDARTLNIVSDRRFTLALTLQLGDASIDKVREALSGKIPEDSSRGEDTVDTVGRILKL
jgi:hypothetical protein